MIFIYIGMVIGNSVLLVHDGARVHMVFFLAMGAFALGLAVPKKVVEGA